LSCHVDVTITTTAGSRQREPAARAAARTVTASRHHRDTDDDSGSTATGSGRSFEETGSEPKPVFADLFLVDVHREDEQRRHHVIASRHGHVVRASAQGRCSRE
jgi:hypothetical protein